MGYDEMTEGSDQLMKQDLEITKKEFGEENYNQIHIDLVQEVIS